ncbi:MAG: VWA domain-containing protein [Planctomycetota bacterium]|nr:VWA domain-containing protein [Planctomycetota bacterium]
MSAACQLLAAHVDLGPLRWANLPPAWLLVVLVAVGFFWIRSLYRQERGRAGPVARLLLTCIRTAVLVAVLLILGGPFRLEETRAIEKSHLVVLVDSSASMNVKDTYEPEEERRLREACWPASRPPAAAAELTRADYLKGILAEGDRRLLRTWAERFVLHVFAFDGDWRSLGSTQIARREGTEATADTVDSIGSALDNLSTDGGRTRLGAVLRNVANEFGRRRDQHLAGVVLLSDGRDTSDGEPPQQILTTLGPLREQLRVRPIGLGNPASGKNLWVERIRARDVVLVDDDVAFESGLRHTGFDGMGPVDVTMSIEKVAEDDGTPLSPPEPYRVDGAAARGLETRIARLGPEGEPERVRLHAPFRETGTFRVTVRAKFATEADQRLDSVREDDVRHREIRVKDQRIKVLYVDNHPRHDWRFLSNYLTREPGREQEGRVRDARGRFEVHVLLQSADPTYRQPASVGIQPISHFPNNRQELFAYDVILFGDVDWRRLAPGDEQADRRIMQLIEDFVREGGGVSFQPGVDYHTPMDLIGTPLAPLLPLNVGRDDLTASDTFDDPFRIRLTEAGALHPIFAVVAGDDGAPPSPEEVAAVWAGDHAISSEWAWWWMYRAVGGLRPGAIDLARVQVPADRTTFTDQRGEPLVVFASMPYGRGLVFWSSLDTISRIRRAQRDRIYGPFWEQVIRYLATYRLLGGNARFKIFTDKDAYFVGETAELTITALDENFEPLREPVLEGVHLEIGDDPTTATSVRLEGENAPRSMADDGQPGTYRLLLPLKKRGLVRIWIDRSADVAGRATKGRAEKRFEVTYRTREDMLKVPDHDTLLDIAKATQPGVSDARVYALHELEEAVAGIQALPRERVLDRRERTQWDKTWVLLLITSLLAVEWLIRKRYQMI